MDLTKPHKGRLQGGYQLTITNRTKDHLGYIYVGKHLEHPVEAGRLIHTSLVVKDNCDIPRHASEGYMIETENSRYTIVPDETYR